jgi:hypothetical protein
MYKCTVKPVIRCHLWDRDGWSYNECDIVNKGSIHMIVLWQDKKIWSFNTGYRLILVSTWPGLIVYEMLSTWQSLSESPNIVFNL